MVLVQRKRRRWGAFITLHGPALIAPIKADQQSAWRHELTLASMCKADFLSDCLSDFFSFSGPVM
ncbi:hypothetical protein [Brevundimonas bullata]|uniref:hypothetical protein n=1 Tax=Brevundimonas bullata TaxID=13160 RepID=UPI0019B1B3CC|nr:hypothetical protein [Brevundimonas sp.]